MTKKKELRTIEDFKETYGYETMERLFMEYLLIMREQAKRFQEIENVLSSNDVTIADIRKISE